MMCFKWGLSCEEKPMKRARPVFFAQSRAFTVHEQADPPEIDVIETRFLHAFVQTLLELLGRPPLLEAALLDVPGVAEVHLVPPALEGLGIGEDLLSAAGVHVVDTPFDAASDHVVPVLLESLVLDIRGHPALRLTAPNDLDEALPVPAERHR
jgi:hypothetical protein